MKVGRFTQLIRDFVKLTLFRGRSESKLWMTPDLFKFLQNLTYVYLLSAFFFSFYKSLISGAPGIQRSMIRYLGLVMSKLEPLLHHSLIVSPIYAPYAKAQTIHRKPMSVLFYNPIKNGCGFLYNNDLDWLLPPILNDPILTGSLKMHKSLNTIIIKSCMAFEKMGWACVERWQGPTITQNKHLRIWSWTRPALSSYRLA